jgi:hypothetical protein
MGCFLLGPLGYHRFGRDQKTSDGSRTLQRVPHHLRRVDDALAREIAVLTRLSVVTKAIG